MALINFNQTDTASPCGNNSLCSGNATLGTISSEMDSGAALGSGEQTTSIGNALGIRTLCSWASQNSPAQPGVTTWQAGNYVIRINVSTGHMDLRLSEVHVCKYSNACGAVVNVVSETGLDIQMTGGVITRTLNRVGDLTVLSDDLVFVSLGVENVSAMFNRTLGITMDQIIDTPIDDGVAPAAPGQPKLTLMGVGF